MYTCVYIYMYIHMCMYMHIFLRIYMYICVYVYVYGHAYISLYTRHKAGYGALHFARSFHRRPPPLARAFPKPWVL